MPSYSSHSPVCVTSQQCSRCSHLSQANLKSSPSGLASSSTSYIMWAVVGIATPRVGTDHSDGPPACSVFCLNLLSFLCSICCGLSALLFGWMLIYLL
jgi:hypothetical protein